VFAILHLLFIEFTVLLCAFLALSAAPLECLRVGRILGLMAAATFPLLAALFGLVPYTPAMAATPLRLWVASGLVVLVVAALETWMLRILVTDWRAAGGTSGHGA
jgi:hypothetical protein